MSECACGGKKVLIFACSGAADVGALSDQVARKLAKDGKGNLFCTAAIGANITAMVETAKKADEIIAIDGCGVLCAKKTLENASFRPKSYNLTDFGFQKGKTEINSATINAAAGKLGL
jgi:uncharacterized metal-binding protein